MLEIKDNNKTITICEIDNTSRPEFKYKIQIGDNETFEETIVLTRKHVNQIIEYLQEQIKDKEMCEREETIERLIERVEILEESAEKLENEKVKPIVTVMTNLLAGKTKEARIEEFARIRRELPEYHVIPVLNKEAIHVCSGEEGLLLGFQPKMVIKEPIEPELKASDFPCLIYFNGVSYFDKLMVYKFNYNSKTIISTQTAKNDIYTNENIRVEKCKFKDIQIGDLFMPLYKYCDKDDLKNYYYCNKIDDHINAVYPKNEFTYGTYKFIKTDEECYRFTLK